MTTLHRTLLAVYLSALALLRVESFAPRQHGATIVRRRAGDGKKAASSSALRFGLPSFFTPKGDNESADSEGEPAKDKKIGAAGLVQLITAGMGAPFLGDYQGVDEETGKMMFTLEANNLVDSEGRSKQTQMPYFESGWVDPDDEKRAAEGFKFPWQK